MENQQQVTENTISLYKEIHTQMEQKTSTDISKKILTYFTNTDRENVEFRHYSGKYTGHYCDGNNNGKYIVAYTIENNKCILLYKYLTINTRHLLSCIVKKNGKRRYYLTTELDSSGCSECGGRKCNGRYCRGSHYEYYLYYKSTYIGNDLDLALSIFHNIPSPQLAT